MPTFDQSEIKRTMITLPKDNASLKKENFDDQSVEDGNESEYGSNV